MGIIFHPGDTLEYLNEYGKKEPLIRVIDLHRHFQMGSETVHALDGVTLTAAEGEFLGVMGPSGSGKSTLLHLLGGAGSAHLGLYPGVRPGHHHPGRERPGRIPPPNGGFCISDLQSHPDDDCAAERGVPYDLRP